MILAAAALASFGAFLTLLRIQDRQSSRESLRCYLEWLKNRSDWMS